MHIRGRLITYRDFSHAEVLATAVGLRLGVPIHRGTGLSGASVVGSEIVNHVGIELFSGLGLGAVGVATTGTTCTLFTSTGRFGSRGRLGLRLILTVPELVYVVDRHRSCRLTRRGR